MRISLFEQYGALNSAPVFQAIKTGLHTLGIQCSSMDTSADVAVIWSQLWSGRMKQNQQIWNLYRSSGRPVIIAEIGAINRGVTWKLGINGTGSTAHWGQGIIPNRAKQLNLNTQPWTNAGKKIVIAVQRTDSEQWAGMPPIDRWVETTIDTLRQHTDRPIIVRAHPRQRINLNPSYIVEVPQPIRGSYDSFDYNNTLNDTWAVINWNSGPAIQSILAGVPAFVGSSSLATPVANLDLSQIENPLRPDRTTWIEYLAHTEWTIDEIATGLPLQRLITDLP